MKTVLTLCSSFDSTRFWHTETESWIQTHPHLALLEWLLKKKLKTFYNIHGIIIAVEDSEWDLSAEKLKTQLQKQFPFIELKSSPTN